MNVYQFRSGHSLNTVNAQAVGEELERIRTANNGLLTAAIVLQEASDLESPLHDQFTWDNDKAAEKHRLTEARRIIVSVQILNTPIGKPTIAYVNVRSPEHGRSYIPTMEAMSDEELRIRVLTEIRQAVESIERRYAHFAEVTDLLTRVKKSVG